MDKNFLHALCARVIAEGEKEKERAAYSGSYDIAGRQMITEANYYMMGMQGNIPPEWRKYAAQIKQEADPEFAEYERLKNKFEGSK